MWMPWRTPKSSVIKPWLVNKRSGLPIINTQTGWWLEAVFLSGFSRNTTFAHVFMHRVWRPRLASLILRQWHNTRWHHDNCNSNFISLSASKRVYTKAVSCCTQTFLNKTLALPPERKLASTYQPTRCQNTDSPNSKQQNPSSEAHSSPATHEIPWILCKSNVITSLHRTVFHTKTS
jgi:hypothetical protein